jgi:hypothetical protein
VPIEWLENCWHQFSSRIVSPPVAWLPAASSRERRPDTTQPFDVPGGFGQPSDVTPGEPQRGGVPPIAASAVYSTYTYGVLGKSGCNASPSRPRSPKLWTFVRRSAKTSGDGSSRPSNTLTSPLFSATKTLPSDAKRATVGSCKPSSTMDSRKPLGSVAACAVHDATTRTTAALVSARIACRHASGAGERR